MANLTIEQIRAALVRGDVNVSRDADGAITAVKVAPFNDATYQADEFVDCSLGLFLGALIGAACVGAPKDRTWPGHWWSVYGFHVWHEPEED